MLREGAMEETFGRREAEPRGESGRTYEEQIRKMDLMKGVRGALQKPR
jgi:hypothetical protein